MTAPEPISPACPRCAYDLSGHTAMWDSACPVNGQCSECGLEFRWREILRQDERVNRRYIEHCRPRAIHVAAVRTLAWCILPWVFWRRVKLNHEPRVRRMVLWLAIVLLGAHLLASSLTAVALWRIDSADAALSNAANIRSIVSRRTPPVTMAQPGFGAPHLVMALAYPYAYARDTNHLDNLAGMNLGPSWRIKPIRIWRDPFIVCGLAMTFAYWLMLSLLPWTRRGLRIRKGHLLRAVIFGLTWTIARSVRVVIESAAYLYRDLTAVGPPTPTGGSSRYDTDWPIWTIGLAIWISTWWYFAIARGLRFPKPFWHWGALSAVSLMFGLIMVELALSPFPIGPLFDSTQWFGAKGYSFDFTPQGLWHGAIDIQPP